MELAQLGLRIADPISVISFGVGRARAVETPTVTEHNDVDVFGLDESDLLSLFECLRNGEPDRKRQTEISTDPVSK